MRPVRPPLFARVLTRPSNASEGGDILDTRKDETADAYLASRPHRQRAWEKYAAAREEADDLGRQVGHAMSFGLMRPPELDTYLQAGERKP
jgi:hypothetical protein